MSEDQEAHVSEAAVVDADLEARAEALMKLYHEDMMNNPQMIAIRPGSLTIGQRVEFDVVQGPHGPRAVAVRPIDEA